jgi:hypothetical protein
MFIIQRRKKSEDVAGLRFQPNTGLASWRFLKDQGLIVRRHGDAAHKA